MNYLDWAKKALIYVNSLNIQSNNIGTGELSSTQSPLREVVGSELTIIQTYEHVGAKWPPEELRKALEKYKYFF